MWQVTSSFVTGLMKSWNFSSSPSFAFEMRWSNSINLQGTKSGYKSLHFEVRLDHRRKQFCGLTIEATQVIFFVLEKFVALASYSPWTQTAAR